MIIFESINVYHPCAGTIHLENTFLPFILARRPEFSTTKTPAAGTQAGHGSCRGKS